jgi:hypothetical protein
MITNHECKQNALKGVEDCVLQVVRNVYLHIGLQYFDERNKTKLTIKSSTCLSRLS